MDHYRHYTVENFVQDLRFRSWVRNPSQTEEMIWQSWIRDNPHKRMIIEEARAIVLSIHPVHTESISDAEILKEVQHIMLRIDEEELVQEKQFSPRRSVSFWLKIAASVSVLLIAAWYSIQYFNVLDRGTVDQSVASSDNQLIEYVNKSGEPLLINLPDRSSVLLSPNSLIQCPKQFTGNTRDVVLQGTAFFEVTKNPEKPFFVKAGEIVAKVLGTSFEISSNPTDKQIRVVVKTGTVRVYSSADDRKDFEMVLTKNDQLVYKGDQAQSQIQHTRLDSSSVEKLKVPDTYMNFRSTPVANVFSTLVKAYGVQINYENADVANCSVTASFTDEPFTLKLDLICRSIGVKYEIVNDHVTISGNGCSTN
jgi:ferric-dicitrate binding protein FerR (iron transport regulator)